MLSTLELVKRELKQTKQPMTIDGQSTNDATVILRRIDALIGLMENDQRLNTSFVAEHETYYYDAQYMSCNGNISSGGILYLDLPLISLTSLTLDGDAVDSDNILTLPRGKSAKTQIKLLNGEQWPYNATVREGAIAVEGEWAWHNDLNRRWLDSNDTVKNSANATTTSIDVNDVDGLDTWNDTPRFSAGQLLKIDSEYLYVRDTNTDTNKLTVMRGQRGTDAATHSAGATIYIWNGVQAAQDFVTRAATLQYRQRGEFIRTKVEGVTEIHYPTAQTMPEYKVLLQLKSSGNVYS
jgi:hypothetical protein